MQHPNSHNHLSPKGIPWPLLIILLLFIVPFILAFFLYRFREEINFKYTQSGELVTPPVLVNTIPALTVSLSAPKKWQLIYLEPSPCDAECNNRLDLLKRVQQALGKDQTRVQLQAIRFTEPFRKFAAENSILVVDPRGFLILVYPTASFNAKGLLEDMRRLLRFSHVG